MDKVPSLAHLEILRISGAQEIAVQFLSVLKIFGKKPHPLGCGVIEDFYHMQ